METKYSIYGLYSPDGLDLRYIGITKGHSNRDIIMRLSLHLASTVGGLDRGNTELKKWIGELIDNMDIPKIKLLKYCDNKSIAIQEEAKLIVENCNAHDLLNMMHNPNTPQQFHKSHDFSKPFRKLNETEVREIVRLWNDGKSQMEICKLFSVTQTCISGIICGKNWRHLKMDINEYGSRYKKPKGRKELYKRVAQIDPKTLETIRVFKNSGEAADSIGCTVFALIPCLRGKRNFGRGYIWKYVN
jgi:hypothetical protein